MTSRQDCGVVRPDLRVSHERECSERSHVTRRVALYLVSSVAIPRDTIGAHCNGVDVEVLEEGANHRVADHDRGDIESDELERGEAGA